MGKLFGRSDIREEETDTEMEVRENPGVISSGAPSSFVVGKKGVDLSELIGELKRDHHYHIPSLGNWSSHHMLLYLLSITGPATVYLTSWAITEEPLRMILKAIEDRKILDLHCIFDNRVKLGGPQAYQLAKANFVNMKLTKCHAKVMVIENDDWCISVVGSANLSRNPRIECYVICTVDKISRYHKEWILEELDNAHPFEE